MKKFAWLVSFIVVLSIVLTACGGGAANTATEKFRVAIVMPSSINDLAFSQSMYDALMKIQTEMGGPEKFEIVSGSSPGRHDDANPVTSVSP